MMDITNKKKISNMLIVAIFLIMTIYSAYIYLRRSLPILDFAGNRTICGYVLHGIYPYSIIGKEAIIESLGSVPVGFGNLPFGLLLGNIIYFGFLNYEQALLCYYVETIVLLFLVLYFGYKYIKKYCNEFANELFAFFAIFAIFSVNLLGSLRIGNAGHIVCMFLLISVFTFNDNKWISGICLSLAMIKPQIAVPFCITFLLYKKFSVVFIAAIIDIISSFICAFMVKTNIITMFYDFLNNKVGSGWTSYGMLTIFFKNDYYKALFPSMLFGVLLLIIFRYLLRNKNTLIIFSFPAIVANIWSYGWSSDYYILILPAIACIYGYLIIRNTSFKLYLYRFLLLISSFACLFIWCMKHVFRYERIIGPLISSITGVGNVNIIAFTYCYLIEIIIAFIMIIIFNDILDKKNEKSA